MNYQYWLANEFFRTYYNPNNYRITYSTYLLQLGIRTSNTATFLTPIQWLVPGVSILATASTNSAIPTILNPATNFSI